MSVTSLVVLGCLCLLGLAVLGNVRQRRFLFKAVAVVLLVLFALVVWMVLSRATVRKTERPFNWATGEKVVAVNLQNAI